MIAATLDTWSAIGIGLVGLLLSTAATVGLVVVFRAQISKQTVTELRTQVGELRGDLEFERGECDRKLGDMRAQVDRLVGRLDANDDKHADRIADRVIAQFEVKLKEES